MAREGLERERMGSTVMNEAQSTLNQANVAYRAMMDSPFSILEFWRGRWVFSGCFDDEKSARGIYELSDWGTPQVLRRETEILESRYLA